MIAVIFFSAFVGCVCGAAFTAGVFRYVSRGPSIRNGLIEALSLLPEADRAHALTMAVIASRQKLSYADVSSLLTLVPETARQDVLVYYVKK